MDTILGMETTLFIIVAGGGGLVLVTLVLFLILRSRGDDFDFEDEMMKTGSTKNQRMISCPAFLEVVANLQTLSEDHKLD